MNWIKLPKGYQVLEQVGDCTLAYNPGTQGPRYAVWKDGDDRVEYFSGIVVAVDYFHQQWGAAA